MRLVNQEQLIENQCSSPHEINLEKGEWWRQGQGHRAKAPKFFKHSVAASFMLVHLEVLSSFI